MDTNYILSQICSFVALIFFALTFATKRKNTILQYSVLMALFYSLEYLLLGSLTGFLVKLIGVFRGIWYYFELKIKGENSHISLILVVVLTIVSAIFTWKSVTLTLIPVIANLLYAYALWQKDSKKLKIISFFVSCLWIVFSFYVNSIVGVISRIIILIVQFILFMFDIRKND